MIDPVFQFTKEMEDALKDEVRDEIAPSCLEECIDKFVTWMTEHLARQGITLKDEIFGESK